ncbi:ADP-ribose pyrophosphatase [Paenibacillus sp. UNCCL117]|uniref:NUDIX domain-containing protein n=1 Tax=unclassified Paenibacillus TaxID=185978 RepID=UPI000885E272|nr:MULTISPECIES: NUDIX hydrolase [unclassified Paenibacillus]SDC37785.1 ADP-ribose pyrophosphatase [Paenibacillus sp. cl123]SFW14613.1 ADP-ribose pyrophosphatase [Paenibacillus sp. UNCCL117]
MSTHSQKKFEEVTLSTKPIFEGKIISLQVDTVRLPDGGEATREIVKHPGAVAVLALTGDGRMIVVEQYRKPLEKSQVEIPAGKLDAGEDPLEAARRELEEETGYTAGSLRHVASFYTSPGFADELLHLYVAEQLASGVSRPDDDEFLEAWGVTLEEAKELIRERRISDAKTILAVYAWQLYILTGSFE